MRGLARVGCSMRGVRVPRGAVTAGARRTSCESARGCGSVVCPSGNFAFAGTRGGMEVAAVLRGRPRPRLGAMTVGVGTGSPGARRASSRRRQADGGRARSGRNDDGDARRRRCGADATCGRRGRGTDGKTRDAVGAGPAAGIRCADVALTDVRAEDDADELTTDARDADVALTSAAGI